MVYDFQHTCKNYNKNIYNREYFEATPCPVCSAVGRFKMHGSYYRHAIYFKGDEITCRQMEIKRILCTSCRTTHAVLPGDIIPYKALTLLVFIFILTSFYLEKTPVLEIARDWEFSFQLIYYVMHAFHIHMNNIRQYFREAGAAEDIPDVFDACGVLSLIKMPYIKFQSNYIELNRRPCFMCKFFDRKGAPPIGMHAPNVAAT